MLEAGSYIRPLGKGEAVLMMAYNFDIFQIDSAEMKKADLSALNPPLIVLG